MPDAAKEYDYWVELRGERLSVFLLDDSPFIDTHTNAIRVVDGIFISLSGTNPTIVLDLVCTDIASLLANDKHRKLFAQLCGPTLHSYLTRHDFCLNSREKVTLSLDEIKTWQSVWLPIQNEIFASSGKKAVVLFEDFYEDDFEEEEDLVPSPPPDNVIYLFPPR